MTQQQKDSLIEFLIEFQQTHGRQYFYQQLDMLRSLHFHWKEHDFGFKSKDVSLYGLALQTVFDNVIRLILQDKPIATNLY